MSEIACRHCDLVIYEYGGVWWHEAADGSLPKRGCRAASYWPGLGWDEFLGKKLMAEPVKVAEADGEQTAT